MKKITPPKTETFARVRVIGVGGSGKNVTNHMIASGLGDVEFIVANTDSQDLKQSKAKKKIHLGKISTKGLGTGMDPNLGKSAAEESSEELTEAIKGADILFIACGMGGGTGTGAAPVIARIAEDLGILTVAVVTKPFSFEGGKRKKIAEEGIQEIVKYVDSLVVIPNDSLLKMSNEKTSMAEAFAMSDDTLLQAVESVTQLILKPGEINVDFADLRSVMQNSGLALLGTGTSQGSNRAEIAVSQALSSPLLETSIKGSRRVLFSISSRSRSGISMMEIQKMAEIITESIHPDAQVIFGTDIDTSLPKGSVRVSLIATGLGEEQNQSFDTRQKKNDFEVAPFESQNRENREIADDMREPETEAMDTDLEDDFDEDVEDVSKKAGWKLWRRK